MQARCLQVPTKLVVTLIIWRPTQGSLHNILTVNCPWRSTIEMYSRPKTPLTKVKALSPTIKQAYNAPQARTMLNKLTACTRCPQSVRHSSSWARYLHLWTDKTSKRQLLATFTNLNHLLWFRSWWPKDQGILLNALKSGNEVRKATGRAKACQITEIAAITTIGLTIQNLAWPR